MSRVRDGLAAGAVAAALSGGPSTIHAALTGRDLLDTIRAAGSIALPDGTERQQLLAAPFVHGALSLGWGVALSLALPRRHAVAWGFVAGVGIAALDLGLIGRRYPQIRALPQAPQVADHIAFGAIVGWVLGRRARAQRA
ncbi:MAG: hypothetical protein LC722_01030 [Actinobacteria bacterium]|nr:hypothetical protein [Actinomycetota bacterium]